MTRSSLHARSGFFAFSRQCKAVIEPGEAAKHVVIVPCRGGRVAYVPRNTFRVVERPERTGFKLHPRGAQQARGRITLERDGEVTLRRLYCLGETHGIL